MLVLERIELERFITATSAKSAQLAAQKALEMAGLVAPFLTLRAAYKQYGGTRVKRWIERGLVKPVHEGGNTPARVSVSELINAAINEESIRFFNNAKTNKSINDGEKTKEKGRARE